MRGASPFGLNPPGFFSAVTQLGPQRIASPIADGGLLVIGKVTNRPHEYVCLPDNTYVPKLFGFNLAPHQPLTVGEVSGKPDATPLVLVMARPYDIGDLIQRLAEHAIVNRMADPTLTELIGWATNQWFNVGLIAPASAGRRLAAVYNQRHLNVEGVLESLATVEPTDIGQLRSLAVMVVEHAIKDMARGYSLTL